MELRMDFCIHAYKEIRHHVVFVEDERRQMRSYIWREKEREREERRERERQREKESSKQ